ncbi:hypothetical protein BDN71DRAFT_1436791 [Pleurotus eryngii]|uniref:Uncharacterized protein n=1 Tax=Pleurotus eryngii TaxID=5323 RepID=A0A9P5ZHG9_PLEER|nr:hypothetical protein BDN71DRAFT_1436791 [Pleurotus eryngii]
MNCGGRSREVLENVSADSLAKLAGVIDGANEIALEGHELRALIAQLNFLRPKPEAEQEKVFSELAAKHLPALADQFRTDPSALNPSMRLMNLASHTPYFARFLKTPGGQGIAALHVKHGIADVEQADKTALMPKLRSWIQVYRGQFAAETSSRCIASLTSDPTMRTYMTHFKALSEGSLHKCGGTNCGRSTSTGGGQLLQCSRCKSAVYVSSLHLLLAKSIRGKRGVRTGLHVSR